MRNIFVTLMVLLFFNVVISASYGADCKQVAQAIKKERNFMKKKALVEESIVICPDNAVIIFQYAFSRERYNHLEEALRYYQKAVELEPEMVKAIFGMADVYAALGQKELAVMAYSRGLSLDPINVRAIRSKTILQEELASSIEHNATIR